MPHGWNLKKDFQKVHSDAHAHTHAHQHTHTQTNKQIDTNMLTHIHTRCTHKSVLNGGYFKLTTNYHSLATIKKNEKVF